MGRDAWERSVKYVSTICWCSFLLCHFVCEYKGMDVESECLGYENIKQVVYILPPIRLELLYCSSELVLNHGARQNF